ncbi:GTPase Obg [Polystyrenella longa]|uniref:GTPase Obg n=1 Tax=Polystyrenella longa TaxID=2528007 RepID=A0A518CH87_9PLAN|nr:GTPase [Polystyrenella longa]QDU78534.1 GTPase Obg [Polystyrenella longa]
MPANLTPQYHKAEEEFRRAQSAQEQVDCLQRMLQLIPKHKGTERMQGDLKHRLKEARDALQTEKSAPKKGVSYRYPRQGAGQIVIVGGPNSGKSRLVQELTNAEPEVADYPFSTREPLPAIMEWEDVRVQLIDTPPITISNLEPYQINLVRTADAAVLCFDGSSDDSPEATVELLQQLEQRKTVLASQSGFVEDDFSRIQIKTLFVVTRGKNAEARMRVEFLREMRDHPFEPLYVDLENEADQEELRTQIFQLLDCIRIYTKAPGKPADYSSPFTIPRGGSVEDLAYVIHRELFDSMKFAKVWGESAHDGQTVGRDHQLCDKDLVELH